MTQDGCRIIAAAIALAATAALVGCAPGVLEPLEDPPAASSPEPTASPTPTPSAASPAPSVPDAAPEASSEASTWAPVAVDTSDWQTFTMPGGEASFRLPASWEVRDLMPFDTSVAPPESGGGVQVYDDAGEHMLGLLMEQEPWDFPCDGPVSDSELLHEEPIDLGATTMHGGETAVQIRNDAGLAISIEVVDGWTPGGRCALDDEVDLQPTASGVAALSFGTGGPGPGIVTPPSFSGPFDSSEAALERIDPELLGTALAIVLSLEVS